MFESAAYCQPDHPPCALSAARGDFAIRDGQHNAAGRRGDERLPFGVENDEHASRERELTDGMVSGCVDRHSVIQIVVDDAGDGVGVGGEIAVEEPELEASVLGKDGGAGDGQHRAQHEAVPQRQPGRQGHGSSVGPLVRRAAKYSTDRLRPDARRPPDDPRAAGIPRRGACG